MLGWLVSQSIMEIRRKLKLLVGFFCVVILWLQYLYSKWPWDSCQYGTRQVPTYNSCTCVIKGNLCDCILVIQVVVWQSYHYAKARCLFPFLYISKQLYEKSLFIHSWQAYSVIFSSYFHASFFYSLLSHFGNLWWCTQVMYKLKCVS